MRKGEQAVIGTARPEEMSTTNRVRAPFLRFLALGGDEKTPVHEHGVALQGAWIDGTLDLIRCEIQSSILAINCHFTAPPVLRHAHIHGLLVLSGSKFPGLLGDGLCADADMFMRDCESSAEIRLLGARIGGDFSCRGGVFDGHDNAALSLDKAKIQGSIFLNNHFKASGTVRLLGAEIGSILECSSGQFDGKDNCSLNASRATIKGDIFLNDGFSSSGTLCLSGAQIGGGLICEGGQFSSQQGFAIAAELAQIDRSFQFRNLKKTVNEVNLAGCHIGQLVDDVASWGDGLVLDGFVYGHIAGGSSCDAAKRIVWLQKQQEDQVNDPQQFRPQPWKQLIRTLRSMGHLEDARQVAIAYEKHRRQIGVVQGHIPRFFHWVFGLLIGYGHRPLRLLAIMFGVWLVSAALFWMAALNGVFAPSNPLVFNHPDYATCRPGYESPPNLPVNPDNPSGNWYLCAPLAGEYTGFSPFAYSLDLLLPLVDLQQEHDWAPYIPTPKANIFSELGQFFAANVWKYHATRLLVWLEILFGWLASLLLVAVVSGLTNRDKDE